MGVTFLVLTLSSPVVPKVTLQSVQSHTGLTHHFYFFDVRALWRSVLSTRVPERQKNKNGGLDQYGFEHFVV